ncbi:AraC family transcriptional regulator [Coralloluteibacterium thermophilus]|uniref:AraC family transcriptional regulator N-terminal domain-containing protein n=1 Tax=Coralloluteibacterium thermophilum TaxID=2707049 RepID=A0ABV9NQB1_9GAMM
MRSSAPASPAALAELGTLIARYAPGPGGHCAIPRVGLLRADAPTEPVPVVYEPLLCLVAQGRKRVMLGEQVVEYDPANYLIASVDLPVTGAVLEASPEAPYLSMSLRIDPALLAEVMLGVPAPAAPPGAHPGLVASPIDADLLDPALRLLRLLERPEDIPVLAPMIEREILYRVLTGEQGAMLRQIAQAGSTLTRIGRAIAWIRRHYAEPFRIETVAAVANMTPSTFHRHFKGITSMSPLQYQKRIRLQEARRFLLANQADAASVGFAVGYESPSQFSREYRRLFGAPPLRDAERLRASGLAEQLAVA